MRRIYLPTLLLSMIFIGCDSDQDLFEIVQSFEEDSTTITDESSEPGVDSPPIVDFEGQLEINTTPCDYNLDVLEANGTLAIDCSIDLEGQTVELPANVTLEYTGGQIINGTLNFDGGFIDGNLMNKDLTLTGEVALSSEIFQFHPERWDIVQGQTTSEIALINNTNLEGLMFYTKELGAAIFVIDQFDAYFEVTKVTSTTTNQNFYPSLEALNIPSNFTLSMSDNTKLRVFPSINSIPGSLIGIREVENVTVIGGVLIGDRDIRSYSGENSESGIKLMTIRSGKNINLEGVTFMNSSLNALSINSVGFSFDSNYDPTTGVIVRSCTFDSNRMMSIALTDGRDIDINGNTFLNTANESSNSDGGVVGYAINLEPVRKRDQVTNELIEYQKVQDVLIRNNLERGSREGALVIFIGQRIIVENNDFETTVAAILASDSEIRNNTFNASTISTGKSAIISSGRGETVFNNTISGNVINGYGLAITAYYKDIRIINNQINDCSTGIFLKEVENVEIRGNSISNPSSGRGISVQITTAENVLITDNYISVQSNPFYFVNVNTELNPERGFDINNNNLDSGGSSVISGTSGVSFSQNISGANLQIINGSNIDVIENQFTPSNAHGIYLKQDIFNTIIENNEIIVSTNYECIKDTSTGSATISNNSCE